MWKNVMFNFKSFNHVVMRKNWFPFSSSGRWYFQYILSTSINHRSLAHLVGMCLQFLFLLYWYVFTCILLLLFLLYVSSCIHVFFFLFLATMRISISLLNFLSFKFLKTQLILVIAFVENIKWRSFQNLTKYLKTNEQFRWKYIILSNPKW